MYVDVYIFDIIEIMNFGEWLNENFLEWRKAYSPVKPSVSDWAVYLGVVQQQLSDWMNNKYKPGYKNLAILAEKLGMEVYDAAGQKRPETPTRKRISIEQLVDMLPPDERERFVNASTEAIGLIRGGGLDPKSSEAAVILRTVYKKYGF